MKRSYLNKRKMGDLRQHASRSHKTSVDDSQSRPSATSGRVRPGELVSGAVNPTKKESDGSEPKNKPVHHHGTGLPRSPWARSDGRDLKPKTLDTVNHMLCVTTLIRLPGSGNAVRSIFN